MASTLNDVRAIGKPARVEEVQPAEGLRLARFCTLEESLGLVFGVMTVAYIVFSLFALRP